MSGLVVKSKRQKCCGLLTPEPLPIVPICARFLHLVESSVQRLLSASELPGRVVVLRRVRKTSGQSGHERQARAEGARHCGQLVRGVRRGRQWRRGVHGGRWWGRQHHGAIGYEHGVPCVQQRAGAGGRGTDQRVDAEGGGALHHHEGRGAEGRAQKLARAR